MRHGHGGYLCINNNIPVPSEETLSRLIEKEEKRGGGRFGRGRGPTALIKRMIELENRQ